MDEVDVVLVTPPVTDEHGDGRRQEPLGLGYLAAVLKNAGYSAKIIDAYGFDIPMRRTVGLVDYINPKIIGISSGSPMYREAERLKTELQKFLPGTPIIKGGYDPTFYHKKIVEEDPNVIAVREEGEGTLVELTDSLIKGSRSLDSIQGTTWHNGEVVVVNPDRPLIQDLDALPFPNRDDIRPENYHVPGTDLGTGILVSRGCMVGGCTFCDIRKFYGGVHRTRSPENIVEEMENLRENYPLMGVFDLKADSFLTDASVWEVIYELMSKKDLDHRVGFETRADLIIKNRDLLRETKDRIGYLNIGFESFSDAQLKRWKKGTTAEQNLEAVAILRELEIPFIGYFLMVDKEAVLEEVQQSLSGLMYPIPDLWTDIYWDRAHAVCNGRDTPSMKECSESVLAVMAFANFFAGIIDEARMVYHPSNQSRLDAVGKEAMQQLQSGVTDLVRGYFSTALEYGQSIERR